jgi:DNA modification methylase
MDQIETAASPTSMHDFVPLPLLPLDRIICGDNCEVMRTMPSESIDLVVTSPPYDDLRTYGGHSWDFYGVAWNLKRLLKPGGVIVWVVADQVEDGSETGTSLRQALHFQSIGLNLHDTMIYQKNSYPFPPTNRYYQQSEYMFVLSKGSPKTFNGLVQATKWRKDTDEVSTTRQADGSTKEMKYEKGKETRLRDNVWQVDTGFMRTTDDKSAYKHPAMFPEALARDHILSWSNEGDVVLDPFSGSGTTAKMAKYNGRRFIGIEVNPEYVAISEKRLLQQVLF